MTDHVTKPIDPERLFGVIEQRTLEHIAPSDSPGDRPIDFDKAMKNMAQSEDIIEEVGGIFLEDIDKHLESLDEAIDERDAERTERIAHTIKGDVSAFGASDAVDTAEKIASLAEDEEFDELEQRYDHFKSQISRVKEQLTDEFPKLTA
jgi:HPt (histidine-containing phosphotransfer) domain-containing protein